MKEMLDPLIFMPEEKENVTLELTNSELQKIVMFIVAPPVQPGDYANHQTELLSILVTGGSRNKSSAGVTGERE